MTTHETPPLPAVGSPVERGVRPPVRMLRLTLQIGADSRRDMVGALMNLARRIDREELSGSGTWGGYSDGGNWELLTDPNQTHEKFFEELMAYLDAVERPNDLLSGAP